MKAKEQRALQWHPAFFAGIQIELEEEREYLTFENEHQLGTKPKEIDVLIIKKDSGVTIRKNIGRIFRKHNLVEYKSPEDYLSIDDFYKVYGYACFYKSDTCAVDEIKSEEITITFVTSGYPHKVIRHLETVLHIQMRKKENAIYYAEGAFFPIQFLVTSKLTDEINFWLHHLTNRLKDSDEARKLLHRYEPHQESNLHKSVMDIIVRANQEMFREEEKTMCDALMEIMQEKFKDELEEREHIGINKGKDIGINIGKDLGKNEKLQEQICKKIQKGKSVEQIAEELEESVESVSKMIETLSHS